MTNFTWHNKERKERKYELLIILSLISISISLINRICVIFSIFELYIFDSFNRRNGSIKPFQKYRKQDPETRYDDDGTRYQCVSIPYRIINNSVEIFMITSRKRGDYIFPGGGWEKNESQSQCVQREAFEEAGIYGNITKEIVSNQYFISDKGNKSRIWGYLLNVTDIFDEWPENERGRKWMTINEVEIALSDKRRAKFGLLWKNGIKYFIKNNLYRYHK